MLPTLYDIYQIQKLSVFEAVINREVKDPGGRFNGESRTVAVAGVFGREDMAGL